MLKHASIALALMGCEGDDKHIIEVPEDPPPVIETEVRNIIEDEGVNLADPEGLDDISVGNMKCSIRNSGGISAMICIYGLRIDDDRRGDHTKYYTCVFDNQHLDCNPIELFK